MLTIVAAFCCPITQIDINNVFLNGDLFEEVYLDLHMGYYNSEPSSLFAPRSCKLHKSIFGLKQASRQWFSKFSHALLTNDFSQFKVNYSLFTKGIGTSFVAILVYAEDILITGPSLVEIDKFKLILRPHLLLKNLSNAKYCLGLELSRSSKGIYLSQRKYCLQILEDCGFLSTKPSSHPMDPGIRLSAFSSVSLSFKDASSYRRLIVRLLYFQIVKPDISFAIHKQPIFG